jgi:CRISPR-associated endonuclease/helicase Cas3
MDIDQFYKITVGFSPNPLQLAVWHAYDQSGGHPALLVRAGTGTGKTEAILLPTLHDVDSLGKRRRIIMVLPSKSLIEDMSQRVIAICDSLSKNNIVDLNITVDMGGSCKRFSCRNGEVVKITYHRHLFADDIIITTLDKFLFRLFGYGEKIKSYIFPHRIFGSSLSKRPFVIFDEAHEYEGLAFANFIKLLQALFIKGKDMCVMSATLPVQFVDFLMPIDATTGPLADQQIEFQLATANVVGFDKAIRLIDTIHSGKELIEIVANEVRKRFDPTKRVIARTEYIGDLIALYDLLQDLSPLIYHGRLTSRQRSDVIQQVITAQKNDSGFLVLATSAIEAGCDLDANMIVTEICNPDSLIQLAGRLNRKGRMKDAELVVVGGKIKPGISAIQPEAMEEYLQDLKGMDGRFNPTCLTKYFRLPEGDWMGEILFDMLWDYVYEGDLTSKPLWDRGILVTRCWEPSVTLCTGLGTNNRPINPVQIGVSRLVRNVLQPAHSKQQEEKYIDWIKKENVCDWLNVESDGKWHASLFRTYYHLIRGEEGGWSVYELDRRNVSCYETDLVCVIQPNMVDQYFNGTLGYIRIPKILRRGYNQGFKQLLEYHPDISKAGKFSVEGNSIKSQGSVWYLDR